MLVTALGELIVQVNEREIQLDQVASFLLAGDSFNLDDLDRLFRELPADRQFFASVSSWPCNIQRYCKSDVVVIGLGDEPIKTDAMEPPRPKVVQAILQRYGSRLTKGGEKRLPPWEAGVISSVFKRHPRYEEKKRMWNRIILGEELHWFRELFHCATY